MNKILIAEDEAAIANLIKTALDGPDYQCAWAADGITASDMLERDSYDLVLLDIMLPGADGYEVLEYCQALEVPVIFLTAKGTVEDRVRGLRGPGAVPAAGHRDRHRRPDGAPERRARGADGQGV